MRRPTPEPTVPGQESVWDYPRPPACEPVERELRVLHDGRTIAQTTGGYRVLETSHPPVYYFPPDDIDWDIVSRADGPTSFCEWKGRARYVDVNGLRRVGWYYPNPTEAFSEIAGYVAFYASPFTCFVGDEEAEPQPGGFYGGWVTSDICGPFKGEPGTMRW